MSRALTKPGLKVSAQIGAVPVPRAVADAAFDPFCATGELPEYWPAANGALNAAASRQRP